MKKLFPFLVIFLVACATPRARFEQQLDRTFNLVDFYVRTFDGTEEQAYLIATYPAVHDEAVNVLEEWHLTNKQPKNAASVYGKLEEIKNYVTRALSANHK